MGILNVFRKTDDYIPEVVVDPSGEDVYEVRTTETSPSIWTYKLYCNGAWIESADRSWVYESSALDDARARVRELKFKPRTNRHIL